MPMIIWSLLMLPFSEIYEMFAGIYFVYEHQISDPLAVMHKS